MATLYLQGEGVAPNDVEAAAWLLKAAEQGDRDAQANLARLYQMGRGVPRDKIQGYMWLALSMRDRQIGPKEFGELEGGLSNGEILEAQRMATEWQRAHTENPTRSLEIEQSFAN